MSNRKDEYSKERNTVLVLKGNYKQFDLLLTLFQSGELEGILGTPILEVEAISKYQNFPASKIVNLSQCLQKNFATAITASFNIIQGLGLLETPQPVGLEYQGSFRSSESESVGELIEQLHTSLDESIRLQAAQSLAEIDPDNSTTITVLVDLMRTTQDEEIRWRAVENLAKIAPNHLPDCIGLVRELRLDNYVVKLLVYVMKTTDEQVSVFLRIHSIGNQTTLPKGSKLIVLDETGELFDQVPSDDEEYQIIQYKFKCCLRERFSVRVTLGSNSITESFVV